MARHGQLACRGGKIGGVVGWTCFRRFFAFGLATQTAGAKRTSQGDWTRWRSERRSRRLEWRSVFRAVVSEQFEKIDFTSYANVSVLDRVVVGKDIAL